MDDADEEVIAHSATLPTDDVPEITAPITIHNQQHNPFFAAMIQYLQSGILPADKQDARRIILQSEFYEIDNDVLIHFGLNRNKRLRQIEPLIHQVAVPPEFRPAIVETYHSKFLIHSGVDKTFLTIKNRYYWPSLYADTRNFVTCCETCQQIKMVPFQRRPPLHS